MTYEDSEYRTDRQNNEYQPRGCHPMDITGYNQGDPDCEAINAERGFPVPTPMYGCQEHGCVPRGHASDGYAGPEIEIDLVPEKKSVDICSKKKWCCKTGRRLESGCWRYTNDDCGCRVYEHPKHHGKWSGTIGISNPDTLAAQRAEASMRKRQEVTKQQMENAAKIYNAAMDSLVAASLQPNRVYNPPTFEDGGFDRTAALSEVVEPDGHYYRTHAQTESLDAHLQSDCSPACPEWYSVPKAALSEAPDLVYGMRNPYDYGNVVISENQARSLGLSEANIRDPETWGNGMTVDEFNDLIDTPYKPGVAGDKPLYTMREVSSVEPTTFEQDLTERYDEAQALLLRKHRDYGPNNIANAPGGPLMGLAVRMHDKVARIAHLLESGTDPENESLRDSFLDLTNYGVIGLMVCDERWPSK